MSGFLCRLAMPSDFRGAAGMNAGKVGMLLGCRQVGKGVDVTVASFTRHSL
jgi:hypothetical protein